MFGDLDKMVQVYVMFYAIWHHLYNLKNVENTNGGVLLLVTLLHGLGAAINTNIARMQQQNLLYSRVSRNCR